MHCPAEYGFTRALGKHDASKKQAEEQTPLGFYNDSLVLPSLLVISRCGV